MLPDRWPSITHSKSSNGPRGLCAEAYLKQWLTKGRRVKVKRLRLVRCSRPLPATCKWPSLKWCAAQGHYLHLASGRASREAALARGLAASGQPPEMSQQAVLKLRQRGDLGERRRVPRHCLARAVRGGPSGAPPCHAQGVAGLRANGQGGAERLRMLRMTRVLRRCCPEAQGHRRWCAIARRNGAARRREAPVLG
jgi:hypothetical protein